MDLVPNNFNVIGMKDDRVNSPSHYTSGRHEAIEVIEDAIHNAPSVESGFLQGQVLKYIIRLWEKDNPTEDAKKAGMVSKTSSKKIE